MPLTEKQIENWRKVLALQIGPYALIMPVAEIEEIKDIYQQKVKDIPTQTFEEEHQCKPVEVDAGAQRYWLKKLAQRGA